MSSTEVFLQDNDPRIVYSSGWANVPALPRQNGGEHGDGAHETSQQGASATLRFRGGLRYLQLSSPPPLAESFGP